MSESECVLNIEKLHVSYGSIEALHGVSLKVMKGEIVSIIGANGAGKSTLLRTISGLLRPKLGEMTYLLNHNLVKLKPHKIVELGIAHSPEGRRIFTNMTVYENLQLGAFIRKDNEIAADLEQVLTTFPRLKERLKQSAGTLSGGEQQMLAIGRALMTRPQLMLLDEPSLGLAPFLVKEIFNIVKMINSRGATVLLVEQNANRALEISNRGYVLETGKVALTDTSQNLLKNKEVQKAYLGHV